MTTFSMSAVAAWRVGVRATFRRRLPWWTAALAAILWLTSDDVRGDALRGWSTFAAIGTMLVTFSGAGRPGDDLQSGALAADLLAGSTPSAVVVGATAGILTAALPGLLIGLAAVGSATARAGGTIAPVVAAAVLATVAWAALSVLGGCLIKGLGGLVILFPLSAVAGLPPEALPLEDAPMVLADAARALWGLLPFPHHVFSVVSSARVGSGAGADGIARHLVVLAVGGAATGAAAVGVLRLRMARGRWG